MKVKGTSSPADLMTKILAREQVEQYVEALNLDCREGHAATAVKLHSTQQRRTQDRHDAEPNTDYNRRNDDQTYTDGLAESVAKTDRTLAQGALSLAREALDSAAEGTRSKMPKDAEEPRRKGWQVERPGLVTGRFRGARAYRSPCSAGVAWEHVLY